MKKIVLVIGVISALLGGLWLLQGLGLLYMQPFLCFANCAPIEGPSASWAIAGFLALTVGVLLVFYAVKRRTQR
jgi:hypothetical protein